jgi:hypothetical protein
MSMSTNNAIFDLEQEIMQCWNIIDDIDLVTTHFVDSTEWAGDHFSPKACDAMMNKYFGLKELYALKFEKLFQTFEEVCKEYHRRGRELKDLDATCPERI